MDKSPKPQQTRSRDSNKLSSQGLEALRRGIDAKGVNSLKPNQVYTHLEKRGIEEIGKDAVYKILDKKQRNRADYKKIKTLFDAFNVEIEPSFLLYSRPTKQARTGTSSKIRGQGSKGKQSTAIEAAPLSSSQPEPATTASHPALPFKVPYDSPGYFVEPSNFLAKINKQLADHQRCVIYGLGGRGKTQTAVQYSYHHYYKRKDYSWVFWVTADTQSNLQASFDSIASQLNIASEDILNWLETENQWLLVFDNANADHPEWLRPFIPQSLDGHVLITSRSKYFDALNISNPLELPLFTAKEAMKFWYKRVRNNLSPEEKKDASKLSDQLGYLPLAMEQAGAFLSQPDRTFSSYLIQYKDRLRRIPAITGAYKENDTTKLELQNTDSGRSIFTTWSLNFDAIALESPASAELLYLSAFLSPNGISYDLIASCVERLGEEISDQLRCEADHTRYTPLICQYLRILAINSVSFEVTHTDKNHAALVKLLQPIARYSLIKINPNSETYTIHRLVQDVLRLNLTANDNATVWLEHATHLVGLAINIILDFVKIVSLEKGLPSSMSEADAEESIDAEFKLRLASHTEKIIEIAHASKDVPNAFGTLLLKATRTFERQQRYSELKLLLTQLLRIYQNDPNKGDLDVADVLKRLAKSLFYLEDYTQALQHFTKAHSITDELEENEARKRLLYADFLTFRAEIYHMQGKNKEADSIFKGARQIYKNLIKVDHVALPKETYSNDIRLITENLKKEALSYLDSGRWCRYIRTEGLLRQVLAIQKITFGPNSPEVVRTIADLARFKSKLGLPEDALSTLKKVPHSPYPSLEKIEIMRLKAKVGQQLSNYWMTKDSLGRALTYERDLYGDGSFRAAEIREQIKDLQEKKSDYIFGYLFQNVPLIVLNAAVVVFVVTLFFAWRLHVPLPFIYEN